MSMNVWFSSPTQSSRAPQAVRMAAVVLACVSVLLLPRQGHPQGDPLKSAVGKLVQDIGIKPGDPGIAVLAKKPERVLVMEGYGLANLATKKAITACTRFELASVSKTFTATEVLILQERGLLSVDDDVRKYLPELSQYPDGPLRIRDLLNHVSGLVDYFDLEDVPKSNKSYWVNTDYLAALGKAKLAFPIGRKYEYNNTNFMLLAIVIARVAGKPYGEAIRDDIFLPAGMKNSFVYSGPSSIPANAAPPCNNAVGYDRENRTWAATWGFPPARRQEEHLEVGDGGIWTNLQDMAGWDTALRTSKLIKPATMKLALTGSRRNNEYGLGWELYRDGKGPIYGFGHDGYWEGFNTSYYNYLTNNTTTVLLSNRGHGVDLDAFWEKLNDLIDKYVKD
jgi:CubicO group peptidase (beta-lactamase class C family)